MKFLITILLSLSFAACAGNHYKYTDKQKVQNSYQFEQQSSDNTIYIYNINGSVEIEGYDGNEIMVDIDKTLSARSEEKLKSAKKEAWFKVVSEGNGVHMFMKTPFSKLKMEDGKLQFEERNSSQQYRYKLDYKVKVPRNTNIHVLAINDGHISIDNIQTNLIYAKNINGEIQLDKVTAEMKIMTVNGDIALNYLDKHIENGHFKSVNGSFDINFVEQPDIEVTYKTLNGHLYTTFDPTEVSSFVQKKDHSKKQGIKYKIKSQKVVKIGSGEHKFYFKTINGDINLIEKSS